MRDRCFILVALNTGQSSSLSGSLSKQPAIEKLLDQGLFPWQYLEL